MEFRSKSAKRPISISKQQSQSDQIQQVLTIVDSQVERSAFQDPEPEIHRTNRESQANSQIPEPTSDFMRLKLIKSFVNAHEDFYRNQCSYFEDTNLQRDTEVFVKTNAMFKVDRKRKYLCDLDYDFWKTEFQILLAKAWDNIINSLEKVEQFKSLFSTDPFQILGLQRHTSSQDVVNDYYEKKSKATANATSNQDLLASKVLENCLDFNRGVILYTIVSGYHSIVTVNDVKQTRTPLFNILELDEGIEKEFYMHAEAQMLQKAEQYSCILGPLGCDIIELLRTYYVGIGFYNQFYCPKVSGLFTYNNDLQGSYHSMMRVETTVQIADAIAKLVASKMTICNLNEMIQGQRKMTFQVFQVHTFSELSPFDNQLLYIEERERPQQQPLYLSGDEECEKLEQEAEGLMSRWPEVPCDFQAEGFHLRRYFYPPRLSNCVHENRMNQNKVGINYSTELRLLAKDELYTLRRGQHPVLPLKLRPQENSGQSLYKVPIAFGISGKDDLANSDFIDLTLTKEEARAVSIENRLTAIKEGLKYLDRVFDKVKLPMRKMRLEEQKLQENEQQPELEQSQGEPKQSVDSSNLQQRSATQTSQTQSVVEPSLQQEKTIQEEVKEGDPYDLLDLQPHQYFDKLKAFVKANVPFDSENPDEETRVCDQTLEWWEEEFDLFMNGVWSVLSRYQEGMAFFINHIDDPLALLEVFHHSNTTKTLKDYYEWKTKKKADLFIGRSESLALDNSLKLNRDVVLYILIEGVNASFGLNQQRGDDAPLFKLSTKRSGILKSMFMPPNIDMFQHRQCFEDALGPLSLDILALLYAYYDILGYSQQAGEHKVSGFSIYKVDGDHSFYQLLRVGTTSQIADSIAKLVANKLTVCNLPDMLPRRNTMRFKVFQVNSYRHLQNYKNINESEFAICRTLFPPLSVTGREELNLSTRRFADQMFQWPRVINGLLQGSTIRGHNYRLIPESQNAFYKHIQYMDEPGPHQAMFLRFMHTTQLQEMRSKYKITMIVFPKRDQRSQYALALVATTFGKHCTHLALDQGTVKYIFENKDLDSILFSLNLNSVIDELKEFQNATFKVRWASV